MAHKVHFYDADKGFDEDGLLRPTRTVETDDPAEMLSLAAAAIQESGSIMSASIFADWRLSETLEEHLRVTNMLARWHEENPIKDAWIGALHEDIDTWNASGVDTPEDLEKYLMLQSFSDHYKEIHGFRPGSGQVSLDMSIEEIEAALEGEIGDPRPEWPGP